MLKKCLFNVVAFIFSFVAIHTTRKRGIDFNELDFWFIILGASLNGMFIALSNQ